MMIWLAPLNLPAVPTMDGFLTTVAKDVAIAAAGGIVVGIALSFTSETDVGLLHTDPKKGHALILGTIALIAVVGVVFLYTRRS